MDASDLRLLWRRYKAHTQRPEHSQSLRSGQIKVAEDLLAWSQEPDSRNTPSPANEFIVGSTASPKADMLPTNGYIVRPTGSGKTVSMIDLALGMNCDAKTGALKFDKRVLILTPTNVLNRQFAAELGVQKYRNPSKTYAYNQAIPEDKVGLYDANIKDKAVRDEALEKNFVVMTYDSFRKAVEEDRLNVGDFALTLLDEVHTKPRGDVNSAFIREHIFNVDDNGKKMGPAPTLAIGATATHLYKTGNTIGDYLFDGADPIHLTPINQAVQAGEISGYRNVIVETSYADEASYDGIENDSASVRHSKLKQEARDDAAIRILKYGHDSITGERYKDKKSVWYCRDIAHANRLAAKINEALGVPNQADGTPAPNAYARAVSGKTPEGEFTEVIVNFNQNKFKALTNADILIQGFDDQEAELCFMVHPTQSPTEVLQMGGRVLRKHPNKHHATIFTFLDPDLENQPTFGELAGSYQSIGGEEEFGPTTGQDKSGPVIEREWPDEIRNLGAHYLTHDIQHFAEKRRAAQSAGKKPTNMWTADEMARSLGVKAEVIKRYVYEPLRGLYDQRHSRQQEILLNSETASKAANDTLFVNGQRFGIGSATYPEMGYWGTSANDTSFCLTERAKDACRFALYGKLPEAKKYLYNETTAARALGVSTEVMRAMGAQIVEAYHTRDAYQRTLSVSRTQDAGAPTVNFTLKNDVMFCLDRGVPKLFFTGDGLGKLYQLERGASAEMTSEWMQKHRDNIAQVKTPNWLNKDEVMRELGVHSQHKDFTAFDKVWKGLERMNKSSRKNPESNDGIHAAMKRDDVAPSGKPQLCVTQESVKQIAEQMPQHGAAGFTGAAEVSSRRSGFSRG